MCDEEIQEWGRGPLEWGRQESTFGVSRVRLTARSKTFKNSFVKYSLDRKQTMLILISLGKRAKSTTNLFMYLFFKEKDKSLEFLSFF